MIVNAFELVPWIYHVTHTNKIETVFRSRLTASDITIEILDVIRGSALMKPAGVPSVDDALWLVQKSGKTTTLWYNPCSFSLDAIQKGSSLVVRDGS